MFELSFFEIACARIRHDHFVLMTRRWKYVALESGQTPIAHDFRDSFDQESMSPAVFVYVHNKRVNNAQVKVSEYSRVEFHIMVDTPCSSSLV